MSKQQYLKAMGIQAYRLRQPLPEPQHQPVEAVEVVADTQPIDDNEMLSYMGLDEGLPDDYGLDEGEGDSSAPALPDIATLDWDALQQRVKACKLCNLCQTRKNTVFGVGKPDADVMIIGEAPGVEEDVAGEPFAGASGRLLDNMLKAIGLDRQSVFIANLLKCHPPSNRHPEVNEINTCKAYLLRQIDLIKPRLILSVGGVSAKHLTGLDEPVGVLRQQVHSLPVKNIPLHVTYHPAYLLRKPSEKGKSWQDLKRFAKALEDT